MTIYTKTYSITPIEYFIIVSTNRLRRFWWLYLLCIVSAVYAISHVDQNPLSILLVIFGLAYPPALFIYLYFWTTSKKNKAIFLDRKLIISDEKITALVEDNSKSEIQWKYIFRFVERRKYWLLYIAKGQFVYIPKEAFQTNDDLDNFKGKIHTP
jgi:hypothetical protein